MDIDGEDLTLLVEVIGYWQLLLLLLLVGALALAWKYGSEAITLLRQNTKATEKIKADIITNHGSENLGKSVDRLTENLWDVQASLSRVTSTLSALQAIHLETNRRLTALEGAQDGTAD